MMQKTLLHLLALCCAATQAWQAPLRRVPQLHAPARLAAPRRIDAFAAALAAAAPALAAAAPARAADASGGDVAGAYVARDAAPELRPRRDVDRLSAGTRGSSFRPSRSSRASPTRSGAEDAKSGVRATSTPGASPAAPPPAADRARSARARADSLGPLPPARRAWRSERHAEPSVRKRARVTAGPRPSRRRARHRRASGDPPTGRRRPNRPGPPLPRRARARVVAGPGSSPHQPPAAGGGPQVAPAAPRTKRAARRSGGSPVTRNAPAKPLWSLATAKA